MIKIDKSNFLERKRVNKVYVSAAKKKQCYISYEVLLFAQNLLVHVQLSAQVSNVLFINFFVRSQALSPSKKQTYMSRRACQRWIYSKQKLTVCRIFLLQLGSRAGENATVLQTQLAGKAHSLVSQSEVAVSLD